MTRRVVALLAVGGLVLAAVGGAVAWRWLGTASDFERAMASLPDSTMRAGFTDWAQVRSLARGTDLEPASIPGFLDRAFERDLLFTSAVAESTAALERHYGFSPLAARWEALGQDESGQVVVVAFDDDDPDLDAVEQRLSRLGYAEPSAGAGEGGTWTATSELVSGLDPDLTPVQQSMAVLIDEGLVVMSDQAASVSRAVEVVRGDAEGLDAEESVDAAGEPVTAVLWAGDFACEDLAMSSADDEDQRVAERLVRAAGGVSPLTGLVVAQQADRSVLVGLSYESSDQATEDLQARVDLAAGEAPGQGEPFSDRLRVTSGEADGETIRLELTPRVEGAETPYLFSELTSGPVLPFTC